MIIVTGIGADTKRPFAVYLLGHKLSSGLMTHSLTYRGCLERRTPRSLAYGSARLQISARISSRALEKYGSTDVQ